MIVDVSKKILIVGLGLLGGSGFTAAALYQWNVAQMDWTPKAGTWFFDAGVGAQAALLLHDEGGVYAGAVGDAKFGIKFNKVPIKLAIDYTPGIGCLFADGGDLGFRPWNFGLSCVYCF